jgi:long-subunit acyl-CoA synthetase (AMP-forming)
LLRRLEPDVADVLKLMDALRSGGARPALSDGKRTWTYRDLDGEVARWMELLDDAGSFRVASRLPNGLEWVALDLALLRSGRVSVPMPDFFSAAQERHVLAASGVDTYITDLDRVPGGFLPVSRSGDVGILVKHRKDVPEVHPGTAKITFTSGTTGQPKGVCLSADHLLATAAGICAALGGGDIERHLCVLPLSLLLENVAGIYANLLNNSEILVPPLERIGLSGSSGLDIERFIAAQQIHAPQSLILVPQLLLALTVAGEFGMGLPDTYRFVAVGGGKVPENLIARAAKVGIPVYEGYGLTECGSVVTLNLPGASRAGSVGKPLPHVCVELREGEIHVSGQTMLGYLGEAPAGGSVATGDLGHFDESGFLHVHGRKKNCFITAFGRNVNPEWIESELQTELSIAHAVVFGEALPQNVACIVPRGEADEGQIQQAVDAVNARLPDYARIGAWRLIPLNDFAASGCLTDNGRPRRSQIEQRYAGELETLYEQVKERTYAALRKA